MATNTTEPKVPNPEFITGDSRVVLRQVDRGVKCFVTSPPYFNVRDYGHAQQIGRGQAQADFLSDVSLVLQQCRRIAAPHALLWIVADSIRQNGSLVPLPYQFAEAARVAGWNLQSSIVW